MARIDELLEDWNRDHQHPANRALHIVGITLIGSSVALLPILPLSIPLGVLGWGAQFAGHYIEGKPPTFTKDPKYAAVGAVWYFRQVRSFAHFLAKAARDGQRAAERQQWSGE